MREIREIQSLGIQVPSQKALGLQTYITVSPSSPAEKVLGSLGSRFTSELELGRTEELREDALGNRRNISIAARVKEEGAVSLAPRDKTLTEGAILIQTTRGAIPTNSCLAKETNQHWPGQGWPSHTGPDKQVDVKDLRQKLHAFDTAGGTRPWLVGGALGYGTVILLRRKT